MWYCADFDCSKSDSVTVCTGGGGGGNQNTGGNGGGSAVDEDSDAVCNDGVDNDQDGHLDCEDYSCSRNPDVTICGGGGGGGGGGGAPEDTDAVCNDQIDNDGDNFVDCDDYDCSKSDTVTVCGGGGGGGSGGGGGGGGGMGGEDTDATCQDGIDNDDDGHLDCDDFDCSRNLDVTVCAGGSGEDTDALSANTMVPAR